MLWQVRILAKKTETYEKLLKNFKNDDLNFVVDDIGCCYMQSNKLNAYTKEDNVEEVLSLANEYVKVLNGILTVNLNLDNDVLSTQEVRVLKDDGKKQTFMFGSEAYDLQGRVIVRTDLNHDEKMENKPEKWIELAISDDKVRKAISIIRFGLNDAVVMYKVYEIIRDDLTETFGTGNKRLKNLFMNVDPKFTDKKMSSFKGSVNDVRVLGDDARHAENRSRDGEMEEPLTLEECKSFIYELFYRWIHYKQK